MSVAKLKSDIAALQTLNAALQKKQDTLLAEFKALNDALLKGATVKITLGNGRQLVADATDDDRPRPSVSVGPAIGEQLYTSTGVRVGDKCWAVFLEDGNELGEGSIFSAKCVALSMHHEEATVMFDIDETEAEVSFHRVFPFNDAGRNAALKEVGAVKESQLEKEAKRAMLVVHALEGDLSVKALDELGNRSVTAMASIVGLNPFTDLKGQKGNDRLKLVAKAAKEFRAKKGGAKLLKDAKAAVAAWAKIESRAEREDDAHQKSVVDAARAVNRKEVARDGRSINTGARPTDAKVGDKLLVDGKWYRVATVKPFGSKSTGVIAVSHNDVKDRKMFKSVEFSHLTKGRNVPVWTPVK